MILGALHYEPHERTMAKVRAAMEGTMPITKKAHTVAQKRQFKHVEQAQLDRGKSPKVAAMSANAAVRDHPSKKRK